MPAATGTKCKDATTPAEKKKCADMMVNALISNEKTAFVEEDRPWLIAMNGAQLEKLVANMGPEEEVIMPVITPTPAVVAPAPAATPVDLTGFLNSAPVEIRALLNSGLRELDNKRAGLITRIVANEQNTFKEDVLKGMDVTMLESIAALLPKPAQRFDFSGRNPGETIINEGEGEEAYVPRTLGDVFAPKK